MVFFLYLHIRTIFVAFVFPCILHYLLVVVTISAGLTFFTVDTSCHCCHIMSLLPHILHSITCHILTLLPHIVTLCHCYLTITVTTFCHCYHILPLLSHYVIVVIFCSILSLLPHSDTVATHCHCCYIMSLLSHNVTVVTLC